MTHPRARHLLPLALGMTLLLTGSKSAHAQEAAPCEVCVSRAVVERCADDARQVDAARGRVVACQRQVDAAAGATAELRAQIDALRAMQRAEEERRARQVEELERRPRWRTVVVVGVTALVVGAVTWEVVR